MAYDFLIPPRKKNENELEKSLNYTLDRVLRSKGRTDVVESLTDIALDKFLGPTDNKFKRAEEKLSVLQRARALGVSPQMALSDDFLEYEARNGDDDDARNLVLSKRASDSLAKTKRVFAMPDPKSFMSKILSRLK